MLLQDVSKEAALKSVSPFTPCSMRSTTAQNTCESCSIVRLSCLHVQPAHSRSVSVPNLSADKIQLAVMNVQDMRQSKAAGSLRALAQRYEGISVPVYSHQRPASRLSTAASNICLKACIIRSLPAFNHFSSFSNDRQSLLLKLGHNRSWFSPRAVGSGYQLTQAPEQPKRPKRTNGCPWLPPGNVGLPILGENLEYLKSQEDPDLFVQRRQAKYGGTFLTNLVGDNMVITTCPEAAKILLTGGKMLN